MSKAIGDLECGDYLYKFNYKFGKFSKLIVTSIYRDKTFNVYRLKNIENNAKEFITVCCNDKKTLIDYYSSDTIYDTDPIDIINLLDEKI